MKLKPSPAQQSEAQRSGSSQASCQVALAPVAPEIYTVALITNEENSFLSASTVKEIALLGGDVSSMLPPVLNQALLRRYAELAEEG